ncbi:MAG: D-alanyl-D-alanine carboxypeptidase/D-alanyl-D-alanine-endopeptidase, partial [Chlamydiia bacterium]|nr:D-alanyl-D-alanine carboxypeptidase/D-alanyl-D-alanine-endopeptidase [Chlamydiia bacterium]
MKKWIWVLACLCLPLFSSGRDNLAVLKNDIERIIHHADPQASVGIDVISMHNHQRLYSKNHKQRFIPASITKLLTLGAAFDLLGANYTYKTGIFTDGKVENGILYGNLYVKGSGDPTLGTGDLEHLVKNLHLKGISEVKGSVVVDSSAFDSTPFAAGWMVEDTAFISSALPSALSINQSCFDIWIRPGAQEASPAIVLSDLLNIELPFLIDNQTHTISNTPENHLVEVTTDCMSKESVVRIAGNMSLQGAPQHKRVPIKEPALMAGVIVKDMMKRYGIVFKGAVHEGITPVDATVLAEHTSDSLLSIGQKM